MGQAYDEQLAAKQSRCAELLAPWPDLEWLAPVTSPESGFRSKAKMVVAGALPAPTLGILDPSGGGVDLRGCGLHEPGLVAALPVLAELVERAAVPPYDVPTRRGELKHLIVTVSPDGELMVRFVLRSTEAVPRLRKHLPWLAERLPLSVVSVNLQPAHKAILEGEHEELLLGDALAMRTGDVVLHLRPQSFFQTNAHVGAALYRQAADWVAELAPASVWDLYCGVGGFALHLAAPDRSVLGVEVSAEAVASARLSAAGLPDVSFVAADAITWAPAQLAPPELVVVNPPRRGIGPDLAGWLETSGVPHVLYSSCNAVTLARDLAAMPSYRPTRARLLDMFPQTAHFEVVTMLARG
jgi:23S rRNA (uracil747-C5)-methyltransferase